MCCSAVVGAKAEARSRAAPRDERRTRESDPILVVREQELAVWRSGDDLEQVADGCVPKRANGQRFGHAFGHARDAIRTMPSASNKSHASQNIRVTSF